MSTDIDMSKWHGYGLKDANLPPPTCVTKDDKLARPDYNTVSTCSEYLDSREVLEIKAKMLLDLMKQSKSGSLFLGAGISVTSADTYHNFDRRINPKAEQGGCNDYASNAAGSIVKRKAARLTNHFVENVMRPTPAHRVLALLFTSGIFRFKDCLSQNHDYLLHRAGVPAENINELHGCWHESQKESNPVVPMSGNLRSDLFQRLLESERTSDFCLSLGSSHSGLNCDRLPRSTGQRHKQKGTGLGTAICSLQATTLDDLARLRIWAKLDDFMMIVAEQVGTAVADSIDWDTDYLYGEPTRQRRFDPVHRNFFIAEYCVSRGRMPPAGTPAIIMSDLKPRIDAIVAAKNNNGSNSNNAAAAASGGASKAVAAATACSTSSVAAAAAHNASRPIVSVQADAAPVSAPSPAAAASKRPLTITVGNYHTLVDGDEHNQHKWTMFVRASSRGGVKSVAFKIHPTFTPSVVVVSTPFVNNKGEEEFLLSRLGWGSFPVQCVISLSDGTMLNAQHELSFAQAETSAVVFQK